MAWWINIYIYIVYECMNSEWMNCEWMNFEPMHTFRVFEWWMYGWNWNVYIHIYINCGYIYINDETCIGMKMTQTETLDKQWN